MFPFRVKEEVVPGWRCIVSDQGKVAIVAPISTNSAETQGFIMDEVLGPCKSEIHPPF